MKWNYEVREIKSLRANPSNPRKIKKESAEQLKKSIERFGFCEPVIINPDGLIIGGHQRIEVLKEKKEKFVSVNVPEVPLNDQEVQELTIRLNKNIGEWDYEILANEFDLAMLEDTGFSAQDLGLEEKPKKPKKEKVCPHCGGVF